MDLNLSVFDHFRRWALKGLKHFLITREFSSFQFPTSSSKFLSIRSTYLSLLSDLASGPNYLQFKRYQIWVLLLIPNFWH